MVQCVYTISGHSCKKPEVVASFVRRILARNNNCKVIRWGGHWCLGLHPFILSTSTSTSSLATSRRHSGDVSPV